MRLSRFYVGAPLQCQQPLQLPESTSHYISRVLRLAQGQQVILFNGDGHDYLTELRQISKHGVEACPLEQHRVQRESPLQSHLLQSISRGERMDYTLQKAVELGVSRITPVFSERCEVKLSGPRLDKKYQHWQQIIISACEQSGRNQLPQLDKPLSFDASLELAPADSQRFILDPQQALSLKQVTQSSQQVALWIGPEGGFSPAEITQAQHHQISTLNLGPRVLRTETAAVATLAMLQLLWGDA